MNLFYWLGVDISAAAQVHGLATVLLVLASPFLIGGGLFAAAVKFGGDRF